MAHIRVGEGPAEEVFERFLHGEQVSQSVRPVILRSWRRCQELAGPPDKLGFPDPVEADPNSYLIRMARPVLDRVRPIVDHADAAVLLVDGQATLVLRYLADPQMTRFFDKVGAVVGTNYSEAAIGTNGTGTALAERRLTRVAAFEHPASCVQPFTGTGVPILDPLTGRALGAVSIVCPNEREDVAMAVLAQQVAAGIERRVLEQSSEREHALFEAYLRTGDLPTLRSRPSLRDLPRADRFLLEEKATELIALGQRAAVEVPLSRARIATLRAVPTTEPAGLVGVVAQVRIQDGPWEPVTEAPAAEIPDLGPVPQAKPATAHPPRESPTDPWLILFGEPGVGKLAIAARRRIRLLYEAATIIGKTLDVRVTAEELAEVAVPRLADHVTIDLHENVLRGEEPGDPATGLRRVVSRAVGENLPLHDAGKPVRYLPTSPQADCLLGQEAVMWPDPRTTAPASGYGVNSLIAVPLLSHGRILGVATFMRLGGSASFEDDDVSLAEEMARHTAVCVDNARRFTRERAMAVALQRSMMPSSLPEQSALEVAHRFLPAQGAAGYDWFDVICLSGARVALVVGDVADRGLRGAASMGRLRTAVDNFASLDMSPGEILTHLDELVRRLSQEETDLGDSVLRDLAAPDVGITGTTCAYAVYDPTSQRCALACAGHPPPAVIYPDGAMEFLQVPPGQPLGLGGSPFETTEVELPEGSRLILYSNGLVVNDHEYDARTRAERVRGALGQAGGSAEQTASAILNAVPRDDRTDDITLLVARTRALPQDHIASWDLASDPAVVSHMRSEVAKRLAAWNLEHLAFNAELIFSELVTNAIRYGSEPIRARMILDRALICEVSDASESSPRPRRAVATDEGGRGLFLVAHIAERWGTRHTHRGKVIWAEQPLTDGEAEPPDPATALSLFADHL
ncbi:SpoIIE family protein phosphatase [Nonomuraea glycinis]|uniref:SpoIIE family protein phosphatase n=1 Tax=Nonomuraea glycinis TaxID=2047744 RepID=UPI0033BDA723